MGEIESMFKRLESADWFYDYTDDHRVWERERANFNVLKQECNKHNTLNQMYKDFKGYHFPGSNFGNVKKDKPQLKDYL